LAFGNVYFFAYLSLIASTIILESASARMRMQKEEKIVVVLLLMAFGSLAVAEWAFGVPGQSIGSGKSDSSISAEGKILEIAPTKTGGNLIIRLEGTNRSVFIPGSSGAKDIQSRVHSGDHIKVKGVVSVYNGKQEIKVNRLADVEIIRP
jgi:hypothetical protein